MNIQNLQLTNSENEDLEIMPGLRITNDKNIIKSIITSDLIEIIGYIEYNSLINAQTIIYYNYTKEDLETFHTDNQLIILNLILIWIDDVLKNIWLYSDNCISCDTAFLVNEFQANSLRFSYNLYSSDNNFFNLTLNKTELNKVITDHNAIETYFHSKDSSLTFSMLEKNFSRIARSLIFIKQAREARNTAYKIANYCSALETIFSTDSTELTHKLSERVSFFLKNEFPKIDTFKTLKTAYGIRSKLIHGDILNNKQIDEINTISKKTDDILRLSMNKIIWNEELRNIFDSKNEIIEKYFEELIFN